jgi:hypothetical protein
MVSTRQARPISTDDYAFPTLQLFILGKWALWAF